MAENKKSFVAYVDWGDTFHMLDDETAGKLIKHLFMYVNDENPSTEDKYLQLAFVNIKNQLKRDLVKYEGIKAKRAENGRNGGIKSGEVRKQTEANEANALIDEANEAVTGTVNDTDTVTDINRAKALVVAQPEIKKVTKDDYQKLVDENTGKELTEVVVVLKDFVTKKPDFLEPYRDYWNIAVQKCNIPQVKSLTDTRLKKLKTRIREPDFDFVEIISKVRSSQKLKLDSAWFSFDWVLENQTNYTKILEGNYDN